MNIGRFLFTIIVFLALNILAPTAMASSKRVQQLIHGNNTFAFELYALLQEQSGNLFFSPYSISSALAMTYAGARGNTALEMQQVLHFSLGEEETHPAFSELNRALRKLQKKGALQLLIANSLWPQKEYPLLLDYRRLTQDYYGISITPVDYINTTEAARQTINQWVEDQTQARIKELIQPGHLTPSTRLALVNAIYFKGIWEHPFNSKYTAEAVFHVTPQQTTTVFMMTQTRSFRYAEEEDLQMMELPYAGGALSMLVILPKGNDALDKVEAKLTPDHLERWRQHLSEQEVCIRLPKFRITWGAYALNKSLESLGMTNAFSTAADFSGMSSQTPGLFIGMVLHKAFIAVNEEGTKAAAATAVTMLEKSLPRPIPVFNADHPFIFLIEDHRTGSILFLGRVDDPT
jgi:serpin B